MIIRLRKRSKTLPESLTVTRPALANNSLEIPRLLKEVNNLSQRLGAKPSLNFVIISEFIWRLAKYCLPLHLMMYVLNSCEKKNQPFHEFYIMIYDVVLIRVHEQIFYWLV